MSQYADDTDLFTLGIPESALVAFSPEQRVAAIVAFSSEMDGYLMPRYATAFPFTVWPQSMRMHCARGAVYILLSARGMNPTTAANVLVVKGYDDAISWLKNVARGIVTLPKTGGSPAPVASPSVFSDESRWGTA